MQNTERQRWRRLRRGSINDGRHSFTEKEPQWAANTRKPHLDHRRRYVSRGGGKRIIVRDKEPQLRNDKPRRWNSSITRQKREKQDVRPQAWRQKVRQKPDGIMDWKREFSEFKSEIADRLYKLSEDIKLACQNQGRY